MRNIAKRTLRNYWAREPRAEQALKAWYAVVLKADWDTPAAVKRSYGNASIVGRERVVFNISDNKYRLVISFNYAYRIGYIRFVGTHPQHDKIDVATV